MKTLIRRFPVAALVILIVAGMFTVHLAAADPERSESEAEIHQLRNQVASLQKKLQKVEERLEQLENIPKAPDSLPSQPYFKFNPSQKSPSVPGLHFRGDQNPKIWGEGECNGWRYYMIPCSSEQK